MLCRTLATLTVLLVVILVVLSFALNDFRCLIVTERFHGVERSCSSTGEILLQQTVCMTKPQSRVVVTCVENVSVLRADCGPLTLNVLWLTAVLLPDSNSSSNLTLPTGSALLHARGGERSSSSAAGGALFLDRCAHLETDDQLRGLISSLACDRMKSFPVYALSIAGVWACVLYFCMCQRCLKEEDGRIVQPQAPEIEIPANVQSVAGLVADDSDGPGPSTQCARCHRVVPVSALVCQFCELVRRDGVRANAFVADTVGSAAEDMCAVCLEGLRGTMCVLLPCAHLFHAECVDSWLAQSSSCPICKQTLVDAVRNNQAALSGELELSDVSGNLSNDEEELHSAASASA
jgi:hypothetical protein